LKEEKAADEAAFLITTGSKESRLNKAYVRGIAVGIVSLAALIWVIGFYLPEKFKPQIVTSATDLQKFEKEGVPDLGPTDILGNPASLSLHKGKAVVVHFWATWCAPCAEEFPSLVKFAQKYKGSVAVFAVTVDESRPDIDDFLSAFGFKESGITVIRDPDYTLAQKYGTQKLPESYVLSKEHLLIRKLPTSVNWTAPDVNEYFDSLVSSK
jgi:cytochrome c biogenesis protein CcmG/thiol:disulfide interchange protein DsbE